MMGGGFGGCVLLLAHREGLEGVEEHLRRGYAEAFQRTPAFHRVRSVDGVAWAVKLYKGQIRARLGDGNFRIVILMGLDDATLVGAPAEMIAGSLADLSRPDAVIVDKAGYEYMWPDEPYQLGRVFEMNDRRAVLVGVCKASAPFTTLPVLYTRYSQAARFVPRERNLMSFVLVKPQE